MTSFDDVFRRQLRELFVWRRDVRRFRPDPLPSGAMERLIEIACLSPSVGLSQPWRFRPRRRHRGPASENLHRSGHAHSEGITDRRVC
jgi:nitroreductase